MNLTSILFEQLQGFPALRKDVDRFYTRSTSGSSALPGSGSFGVAERRAALKREKMKATSTGTGGKPC